MGFKMTRQVKLLVFLAAFTIKSVFSTDSESPQCQSDEECGNGYCCKYNNCTRDCGSYVSFLVGLLMFPMGFCICIAITALVIRTSTKRGNSRVNDSTSISGPRATIVTQRRATDNSDNERQPHYMHPILAIVYRNSNAVQNTSEFSANQSSRNKRANQRARISNSLALTGHNRGFRMHQIRPITGVKYLLLTEICDP